MSHVKAPPTPAALQAKQIEQLTAQVERLKQSLNAAEAKVSEYEGGRWHSFETVQAIVQERDDALASRVRLAENHLAAWDAMTAAGIDGSGDKTLVCAIHELAEHASENARAYDELKTTSDNQLEVITQLREREQLAAHFSNTIVADMKVGSRGVPLKCIRGLAFILSAVSMAAARMGVAKETDLQGMIAASLEDAKSYLGEQLNSMILATVIPTGTGAIDFDDGSYNSVSDRFRADIEKGIAARLATENTNAKNPTG